MTKLRLAIRKNIEQYSPELFDLLRDINNFKRDFKKKLAKYSEYWYALAFRKPYYGQMYGGGPYTLLTEKGKALRTLAQKATRCLEIGSWTGGSSMIIGNELKKKKEGVLYCIDTWKGSPNCNIDKESLQYKALMRDWVYKTFLRNIKLSGLNSYIVPVRKDSNDAIKDFEERSFDLVFIDGDHGYYQFKKDLINYMPLVRVGGLLCGDDMERFLYEVDKERTIENKEVDWLHDEQYHPGITLAIDEVLNNQISMAGSLWIAKRTENGWAKVDL